MTPKRANLGDNVPDNCPLAVVLVDVISDFQFPDAEKLIGPARAVAPTLARLKSLAGAAGIPCIYANDNYGRWRSDFRGQVEHCLRDDVPGALIAHAVAPTPRDYFVLKPKHSGFYETCLRTLLEHLGARTLILAGFATDMCVHMTATDAYLRGYELIVPGDTTAAQTPQAHEAALSLMRGALHARTPQLCELDLAAELARAKSSD